MQKIKSFLAEPRNRKYIYGVARAVIALLVVSGFLVPGFDEMIMTLVAAVLGLGVNELAKYNVPSEEDAVDEEGLGA